MQEQDIGEVTGDYLQRYEFAFWFGLGVSIAIGIAVLLPQIAPKVFQPYSVKRNSLSLVIHSFMLVQFLAYLFLTSYIAYEVKNATLIVDSSGSFMRVCVFLGIQFLFALISLIIFIRYRDEFNKISHDIKSRVLKAKKQKVKQEQFMPRDAEVFNYLIFIAIQELGKNASFRQIKLYFTKNGRFTSAITGEQLTVKYLKKLINTGYLLVEEEKANVSQNIHKIFYLTEHAENFIIKYESKEDPQEDKFQLEYCDECKHLSILDKNGLCSTCAGGNQ